MITLKNVLVATDFSEPSASALDYGRALARTFGANLHLLHVVDSAFAAGMAAEATVGAYAGLAKDLEESGRKQLEATLGEDDRRELGGKTILVTFSAPAPAIVNYAKEAKIDLIVLGTHGRSGWSHLLLGSVAEKVLRTAPCPVLTVRHPEHEFVSPDALVQVTRT